MIRKGRIITKVQQDLVMGIIFLVLAISFFAMTFQFSISELERKTIDLLGPAFVPRLILLALILESFVLIFRKRGNLSTVNEKKTAFWQLRPFVMLGLFLVYITIASLLGYIISTISFLVLSFYILGLHKLWQLAVVPTVITLAIYYLFEKVFDVWLPSGIFSF